jgi:AcrR family transcriptional regulator
MAARRRSAQAHDQILEAALTLFARRGLDNTSMDAIADAAGVSKATIYNHWADKDALCLEALTRLHGLDEPAPAFDSGDTRADLVAALTYRPASDRRELQRQIMPHFWAYSVRNREFGHSWRSRVMEPARTRLTALLKRAIGEGALSADLDLETAVAMLIGPILYREIFTGIQMLPADLAEQVVHAFWRAYRPAASTRAPAARRRGMKQSRRAARTRYDR